jgi:hypothetical protein
VEMQLLMASVAVTFGVTFTGLTRNGSENEEAKPGKELPRDRVNITTPTYSEVCNIRDIYNYLGSSFSLPFLVRPRHFFILVSLSPSLSQSFTMESSETPRSLLQRPESSGIDVIDFSFGKPSSHNYQLQDGGW